MRSGAIPAAPMATNSARARGLPVSEVQALVARCTRGRQFGVLGEPRVNVLQLNLALDALPARRVGANVGA